MYYTRPWSSPSGTRPRRRARVVNATYTITYYTILYYTILYYTILCHTIR